MQDTVSSSDKDCRYLRADPNGDGAFDRYVKDLGIVLPAGVTIHGAAALGWLTPALRIAIPHEYYETWPDFPRCGREPGVDPELRWAHMAVTGQWMPSVERDSSDEWFLHPFDGGDDPDAPLILRHRSDPRVDPPTFVHSNGRLIRPWVDFYPYWQAYRLDASIRAAEINPRLFNTPDLDGQVASLQQSLRSWREFTAGRLERVTESFAAYAPAFEWLSLYRTLAAIDLDPSVERDRAKACQAICQRLNVTIDELQDQIRDVLLVLWQEQPRFGERALPPKLRMLLQQDVQRACEFVESVSERPIDYRNSRWHFPDGMPRLNAQLIDALPKENWLAREEFASFAAMYLRAPLPSLSWIPTTEAGLEAAAAAWAPVSYAFRRFMLLFKRLHDFFNSDRDSLMTFRDHNVVDYLCVLGLVVEKLIVERWKRQRVSAKAMGNFNEILGTIADEVQQRYAVQGVRERLKAAAEDAKLHKLKAGQQLPFTEIAAGAKPAEIIFAVLHNVRIFRNYAAHHDVLDFELTYKTEGGRAIEVVVAAVALVLGLGVD